MRLTQNKPLVVNGKIVGMIRKDRIYISHRDKNHYFRKYNGFGVSGSVLDELRRYDVQDVVIIYTKIEGDQELWIANINDFYRFGQIYQDKGHDFQRILNRKYWRK